MNQQKFIYVSVFFIPTTVAAIAGLILAPLFVLALVMYGVVKRLVVGAIKLHDKWIDHIDEAGKK